jgi:hypothetical protein
LEPVVATRSKDDDDDDDDDDDTTAPERKKGTMASPSTKRTLPTAKAKH